MPGPADISAQRGESHRPEMLDLVQTFYPNCELLGRFQAVSTDHLPTACQSLLAHDDHMTVTLEAWHESLVKVRVLEELSQQDSYARRSILARHSDDAPVQLGIMRIDLRGLPAEVRTQIESRQSPLGRILIRNNLLREVELLALWRIEPADDLSKAVHRNDSQPLYGRSARILVAGKPAVELLEIVTV